MSPVALLSALLLLSVGVLSQGPIIIPPPHRPYPPVPGKILSPGNGDSYVYGFPIVFSYNYTEAAAKLEAPPLVDVYVHKYGEDGFVEVAKNLDCEKSSCVNGILKHTLNLRDYHPLIGTGYFELWTVQENFSPYLVNASRIITKSLTGFVTFSIDLPFGGPVVKTPGASAVLLQKEHQGVPCF